MSLNPVGIQSFSPGQPRPAERDGATLGRRSINSFYPEGLNSPRDHPNPPEMTWIIDIVEQHRRGSRRLRSAAV
jgi:hypothetical protein